MESLLRKDRRIGPGDILAGVGGVLQAAGAGISRLAREAGKSDTEVGNKMNAAHLSADSLLALRKIQGTLKNNWSAASSTTVTIRNGQITRWTLAKGKQMLVAPTGVTASRGSTAYAPRANEEIRGLDDLFPEKPIGIFEESCPAAVRAVSKPDGAIVPPPRSSVPASMPFSVTPASQKPMAESARQKEGSTWSSLLFDESVRRKVRWPVENTQECEPVAVAVSESRLNVPGDDSYISDEVALSYEVNLDTDARDIPCPEDEVLDARSESELLDRFLEGASQPLGEKALFIESGDGEISALEAETSELLSGAEECSEPLMTVAVEPAEFSEEIIQEEEDASIEAASDAMTLSEVMTPLAEAPTLQSSLKNAASDGWHEFQDRVTRWFNRGDKRVREKKLIESDYLRVQGVDIIMQGDVEAREIENRREKLAKLKPQIKELDEELGDDLSSFELLARNNRIISNSIHNLVDQYFYQSALEEDDNDNYY